MKKFANLDLNFAKITGVLLLGCLLTTDGFAKSLYKSVTPDGKIVYSSFPAANSQKTQNISSLKTSAKFSISNNPSYRAPGKS